MCGELPRLWTLKEVSEYTHFALRSLEVDCRAGRLEHVHRGRERLMTNAQVDALIASATKKARPTAPDTNQIKAQQRLDRMTAARQSG
jgi:hypothetical protein